MTTELLAKKIAKVAKLMEESDILLKRISDIFVKNENANVSKITSGLKHVMNVIKKLKTIAEPDTIDRKITLCDDVIILNFLINIIQDSFMKILDKKINIETFLSQTFINETREYNEKVQVLFAKTKKEISELDKNILDILAEEITAEILDAPDIVEKFGEFTKMIEKTTDATALYKEVADKVLQHTTKTDVNISYKIMGIIELIKNQTLSPHDGKSLQYSSVNPFIKNFGLVNTSGLLDMAGIIKVVFKIETPQSAEMPAGAETLIKTCKEKKYDLVLIEHVLNRGIEYNILPLIDFDESKRFDQIHNSDDGISGDIIHRNRTIDYIAKSPVKWNIKYDYAHEDDNNKFVLIVRELYPGKYCVMANKLESDQNQRLYFVRKSNAVEFLQFVKTQKYGATRINNYNEILNKKIVDNMFLFVKPDVDTLKIKSQVADPKYLRNEVYILILSKFKKMLDDTNVKTIYDFSVLVHDEIFLKIFSRVIMNEYYKYLFKNMSVYETENISASEIYASFLAVINIYERDFTKHMHDVFISKMPNKAVFADEKKKNILYELFDGLLKDVLNRIITNESNIFQTLIYKLYLYRLSILD